MCDKLVLERYQRIQTAFVDIGGGVREVLNGLPEELEDGEDARELWEIMTKVREKAKDILRLLEVTREHLEVTRSPRGLHGDVSQVLAGILDRAQQEVVRDTRSLHVEAACRFIWATRQVEELLQPTLTPRLVSGSWATIQNTFQSVCGDVSVVVDASLSCCQLSGLHPACIVLHPPMNPPGEAESASSVTGQTRSRTRTSQPSFFRGTVTDDTATEEHLAPPESIKGENDWVEEDEDFRLAATGVHSGRVAATLLESGRVVGAGMRKHTRRALQKVDENVDTCDLLGVMSKAEEDLLRRCLEIYCQQHPSASCQDVARMSRSELEEATISEWRHRSGIRSKLPRGPKLAGSFMQLCQAMGFTQEKVPAGIWTYALIAGATLPNMERRCLFLERCFKSGVLPEHVAMLASDPEADCSTLQLEVHGCATEADLAKRLQEHLASRSNSCMATKWLAASVVRTENPRAGFMETLKTWLQASPVPGRLLVVSHQPFLPRYQIQASRFLQATNFRTERVEVIGEKLRKDFRTTKSSILLDAVAHWVQIQRESA